MGIELFHADGQTDRYDESNSRFSQLCESALKMLKFNSLAASLFASTLFE